MLVLDEADEMLNKGFKEQIYDVYRYLPPQTQVIIKLIQAVSYGFSLLIFVLTRLFSYLPLSLTRSWK
jgi:hypothetical protein